MPRMHYRISIQVPIKLHTGNNTKFAEFVTLMSKPNVTNFSDKCHFAVFIYKISYLSELKERLKPRLEIVTTRSRAWIFSRLGTDQQHRNFGIMHHPFCHASQQPADSTRTPMSGHGNNISFKLLSYAKDRFRHGTDS